MCTILIPMCVQILIGVNDYLVNPTSTSQSFNSAGMVCLAIAIIEDTTIENNEFFRVTFTSLDSQVELVGGDANVMIRDDDGELHVLVAY